MKNLKVGLIMVLCICLVACTQSQILLDLDLAAAAVAAASNVVGIPAPITLYLADAATALDCAAAAVQKGGTNAQVALAVGLCGLSAAAPNIPGGTPQTIVALVTAVSQAVQKVIGDQATVTAQLEQEQDKTLVLREGEVLAVITARKASAAMGNAFQAQVAKTSPNASKPFKLGHGGEAKVAKIRKTLQDAKAKLPVKK